MGLGIVALPEDSIMSRISTYCDEPSNTSCIFKGVIYLVRTQNFLRN